MFYQKGIDITNAKQMWNFLNDHYQYYTMSSWNGLKSIAHNVKLYKLGLSGDWTVALDFLNNDNYDSLNSMIEDWEYEHPGYKVGFNGRSGGYLVLHCSANNSSILPDIVEDYDSYEDFKAGIKDYNYYGECVKDYIPTLRRITKLVQDFDKLCDDLRDYCDALSKLDFKKEAMQKAVDLFNEHYYDDLCYLGYSELVSEDGSVDLSEISQLTCLVEAFINIADRRDLGYIVKVEGDCAKLVEK